MNDVLIFESEKELLNTRSRTVVSKGTTWSLALRRWRSINTIASFIPNGTNVYGFDTFEGLPEDWVRHNAVSGTIQAGSLTKGFK